VKQTWITTCARACLQTVNVEPFKGPALRNGRHVHNRWRNAKPRSNAHPFDQIEPWTQPYELQQTSGLRRLNENHAKPRGKTRGGRGRGLDVQ